MQETLSRDELGRIAAAARSGKLADAAVLAARAFTLHPTDPVLAALAGAVEYHRGEFGRAVDYLEVAHKFRPDDMTVRGNLAESLYRTGRSDAAQALCTPAAAQADQTLRLARLGAGLAHDAEAFEVAIPLYRIVVAALPDDWGAWNNLGNALEGAGDLDGAIEALRKAKALVPDSGPVRVNLGNVLLAAGRIEEAEAELHEAARQLPGDPTPYLSLHGYYREIGNEELGLAAIAAAAAAAPDRADLHTDHGQDAARTNHFDEAEAAFTRAIAAQGDHGAAYAGLASVYERVNREAELEPLRERAVAAGVDAPSIAFIDALRLKREGHYAEALASLDLAGHAMAPARTWHLRGLLLDRLGRVDEAFAAFQEMNRLWQEEPSQPRERARLYREAMGEARRLATPAWLAGWTPSAPSGDRPAPIFLVGFPRSGTTLLDTMLMSDPRVVVLEEEPFIGLAETEAGGIEALPAMSAEAQVLARARYFERVAELAPLQLDSVIVDKHPMHLTKVPIIRRLFPDARFVLALRHPADALLSCYLTNFRPNNAMANFLDLDDAATLYDMTFSFWREARETFALPVGTVVYERLVEDTARELRPLFAWLGLEWPGDAMDHTKAARARGTVTSASYSQVTEPIYTRAAGRWHRYADHLRPVFDRLRPWAEAFGYSLEDGRIPGWPDTESAAAGVP